MSSLSLDRITNLRIKTNDGAKYLFIWLRCLGIIMPKKHKLLYVIYSIIINLLANIIVPLSFALSYFTRTEKFEIGYFLTSLQIGINISASAVKFIVIAYLRQHLFKIECILEKLDSRILYVVEVREVKKTVKLGHRVVGLCFTAYFSYSTSTFLGALYNGVPAYSLYNPFLNWQDSTWNFILVCVYEYSLVNIACFQDAANDSFGVIYIAMVRTHLKILKARILNIGKDPKYTPDDNHKELVCCINDHKNILALIDAVGPVISQTVFIQFIVAGVVLGMSMINIVVIGNLTAVIGSIFFFTGIILEILPICYFITSLINEGEGFSEAIFHMNWMDQDSSFRRTCLFLMHRTQQTFSLKAGKMLPITLNSFVAIVKFSFSFYTLLNNMDVAARFN